MSTKEIVFRVAVIVLAACMGIVSGVYCAAKLDAMDSWWMRFGDWRRERKRRRSDSKKLRKPQK